MKGLPLLALFLAGLEFSTPVSAAPPANVGDAFFSTSLVGPFGISNKGLFYLGADGSCERLYERVTYDGNLSYSPSESGTYSYTQTTGNPNAATLVISLPDEKTIYDLAFSGDTSGFATVNGFIQPANFSLFLSTRNSFITNVSNRVPLRSIDTAISGFVIEGDVPRFVLIRAVGPSLVQFGVNPASGNPQLNLVAGTGADLIASGQPWSSVTGYDPQAMGWIFGMIGAFPLLSGAKDSVYFGLLSPGDYTVQVSDLTAGSSGAAVLTEVYVLPYGS